MNPIFRPLDRRIAHLEAVTNARSAEVIQALGEIRLELQRIADANEALALNVSEIIESHLRIHAEAMADLGESLAELDRAASPYERGTTADAE